MTPPRFAEPAYEQVVGRVQKEQTHVVRARDAIDGALSVAELRAAAKVERDCNVAGAGTLQSGDDPGTSATGGRCSIQ